MLLLRELVARRHEVEAEVSHRHLGNVAEDAPPVLRPRPLEPARGDGDLVGRGREREIEGHAIVGELRLVREVARDARSAHHGRKAALASLARIPDLETGAVA